MNQMIKKSNFLIIFLLLPSFMWAQNLVPNPSFECGVDLCSPTQDASMYGYYACNWSCPTLGTSDVLSTQLSKDCFSAMPYDESVPHFHTGSQLPRTGNRFAGIVTYAGSSGFREYIQVQIDEPLVPGEDYCFEMYVSLGEEVAFASNNLGSSFTNNS